MKERLDMAAPAQLPPPLSPPYASVAKVTWIALFKRITPGPPAEGEMRGRCLPKRKDLPHGSVGHQAEQKVRGISSRSRLTFHTFASDSRPCITGSRVNEPSA